MSNDPRYKDRAWKKIRLVVLKRDGNTCQLRGPRCTISATQVDHIVRPADGGDFYEPSNLRASCAKCNTSRGGKIGAQITNGRHKAYPPKLRW